MKTKLVHTLKFEQNIILADNLKRKTYLIYICVIKLYVVVVKYNITLVSLLNFF